jgi:hypothetical protein
MSDDARVRNCAVRAASLAKFVALRLDEERRERDADPQGWAKAQSLGVD